MARLLLIEDDQETAEEVAGYFLARGYAVEHAATGPDGLARAGPGRRTCWWWTGCCRA